MKQILKSLLLRCLMLCMLCALSFLQAEAQKMVAYHVVGKVEQFCQGKSSPVVMNSTLTPQTEINIPYGGKVELLDEANARRIVLKKPGRGTVDALARSNDNSVYTVTARYMAYVKKQMSNKKFVQQQRYADFATVTRETDSAKTSLMPGSFADNAATLRESYKRFSQTQREKYQRFRREANAHYADFVRNAWKQYAQHSPVEKPVEPRVEPQVVPEDDMVETLPDDNRDKRKEAEELPATEIVPQPQPEVEPIVPIEETDEEEDERRYAQFPFRFYGTELTVRLDEGRRICLGEASPDRVADAWIHFASAPYDNLLVDCLRLRAKHQLCDWAYLQMLQALAAQFCGEGTDEATLLAGYLFCQSGYQVRFGSQDGCLHLLVASDHIIFGRGFFVIDDERYYLLEPIEGGLDICEAAFPQEQKLSLVIEQLPSLQNAANEGRTIRSSQYADLTVDVRVNRNLLDFLAAYPSSYVGSNMTTRWALYANTPLDTDVQQQLYPTLQEQLAGLSQLAAVNRLLNWVQTGFEYEYDDKVWGGDRAFFAEETLHYPYADCEDRAILFTRLVRDLLHLPCVLVYYPGHLAAAVHFDNTPSGVCYTNAAGMDFTLCDPTYINACVGMEMPLMKNKKAILIPLDD